MPVTHVGAIYATVSKLLQRVYIPHADDSEIAQQYVAVGESVVNIPIATYQQGGAVAVQSLIGAPSFSGRCAIVSGASLTGTVLDIVTADPALYTDLQGRVIASDSAMVGDTYTGLVFTRPYLELDHTTGNVVGLSTQNIQAPTPQVNALNLLVVASVDPSAIVGSSIPVLTAKIIAAAAAV
jgi:hypothetical protein